MKLKALVPQLLGLTVFAVTAISTPVFAQPDPIIKIDGSSTVYPITEAVAEDFQKSKSGAIKVTVGISGTGGGFKKFCRAEIDIANASRPIMKKEMADCKTAGINYVELPVAYDAVTVVTNAQNTWLKSMTFAELKTIWEPDAQYKIIKWNQVNPVWPDTQIKLFGAGSDSGTFDYFTEAIVGKAKSSRGDYTASEDDNVLVQGVSRNKDTLGYFGYAYYAENTDKLRAVPIIGKPGGTAVSPSAKTVIDGTYPLSRPIFIYVNVKALDKPEVREFVEYYLKNGAKLAQEVKYIPLPATAYRTGAEHIAKRKTGTVFGGEAEIGMRIDDMLKREAKM